VESIVSIIPQAVAALIIIVLLSLGAIFIGGNGPHRFDTFQPGAFCTTGSTPVKCVGN